MVIDDNLSKMGGAERFVNNISNGLLKYYDVCVVNLIKDKTKEPENNFFNNWGEDINFSHYYLKANSSYKRGKFSKFKKGIRNYFAKKKMKSLLEKIKPDLILLPNFDFSMRALELFEKGSAKIIVRESSTPMRRRLVVSNHTNNLISKFADIIIVPSQGTKNYYDENISSNVKVLKNFNPVPDLAFDNKIIRQNLNKYSGKMVSFCRLHPNKGFDLMLESMVLVQKKLPNWRLDIIGSGVYKEELKSIINKLNLKDYVNLLPADPNIISKLDNYDMYINTSKNEGFCNALAEAMATGLPSLSVDWCEGVYELIPTPNHGVVVPLSNKQAYCAEGLYSNNDVVNLSESIISYAMNPDKRIEASRVGSEFISKTRNIDKIIDQWHSIISDLFIN